MDEGPMPSPGQSYFDFLQSTLCKFTSREAVYGSIRHHLSAYIQGALKKYGDKLTPIMLFMYKHGLWPPDPEQKKLRQQWLQKILNPVKAELQRIQTGPQKLQQSRFFRKLFREHMDALPSEGNDSVLLLEQQVLNKLCPHSLALEEPLSLDPSFIHRQARRSILRWLQDQHISTMRELTNEKRTSLRNAVMKDVMNQYEAQEKAGPLAQQLQANVKDALKETRFGHYLDHRYRSRGNSPSAEPQRTKIVKDMRKRAEQARRHSQRRARRGTTRPAASTGPVAASPAEVREPAEEAREPAEVEDSPELFSGPLRIAGL